MKNYRSLFLGGILLVIILVLILKIGCNSDKTRTKNSNQKIELREFFHKRITKDLTELTNGYVISANRKFGDNSDSPGMFSIIQLSEYPDFDMIRILMNTYVSKRKDITVMESWSLQDNSNKYRLSLTSELVFVIAIIYNNDSHKLEILTSLNR